MQLPGGVNKKISLFGRALTCTLFHCARLLTFPRLFVSGNPDFPVTAALTRLGRGAARMRPLLPATSASRTDNETTEARARLPGTLKLKTSPRGLNSEIQTPPSAGARDS